MGWKAIDTLISRLSTFICWGDQGVLNHDLEELPYRNQEVDSATEEDIYHEK